MRLIDDYYSINPYFNLAAEAYFLTESKEDICRFWQNENAVVIGKHQALAAEVNTQIAAEKSIIIARRISGGGTVYHDLGNLNFTFIKNNGEKGNMIDFKQFTQPIIDALAQIGVTATHSGRNDLLLNGDKISGNAEHLSQKLNRTLHHGTLLFNSDLENLGAVLKTPISQYEGKFVHSKRSKVCNIIDALKTPIDIKEFRVQLCHYFIDLGYHISSLTKMEIESIEKLAAEKYSQPEWVYGYSPKYIFHGKQDDFIIDLSINDGRITEVQSNLGQEEQRQLQQLLVGQYHRFESLKNCLQNTPFATWVKNLI